VGPPFTVVIVGAGAYGAYLAAKLVQLHASARVLVLEAGPLLVTEHGVSYWRYTTTNGFERRAKVSGEYHLGVSVEACGGGPNNGIDVIALHRDLVGTEKQWGVDVLAASCTTSTNAPVNDPTYKSGITCTVWDRAGTQSVVEGEWIATRPNYQLNIGD
jgi:choline dehydrogenase-like flavoprotein